MRVVTTVHMPDRRTHRSINVVIIESEDRPTVRQIIDLALNCNAFHVDEYCKETRYHIGFRGSNGNIENVMRLFRRPLETVIELFVSGKAGYI